MFSIMLMYLSVATTANKQPQKKRQKVMKAAHRKIGKIYLATKKTEHKSRLATFALRIFYSFIGWNLFFHFETCPNERSYTFRIVVSNGLAHVVIKAAIATIVYLFRLNIGARARAKATNRAAVG